MPHAGRAREVMEQPVGLQRRERQEVQPDARVVEPDPEPVEGGGDG